MNKTFLIFKHEFLTTIKRVGFIVFTLIVPAIILLAIGISALVTSISKPPTSIQVTSVGFVDQAGGFTQFTTLGSIKMVPFKTPADATQAMAKEEVKDYFVIPADYATSGVINYYTLEKQLTAPPDITAAIKRFLTDNLLAGKLPDSTVRVIESGLNLTVTRLTATGDVAPNQGGFGNLIIPGIFALLLVLSLSFSSTYLLQGLGEEKESRLIEVLLSSVSTRQLLTGKVIGLGLAGLAQVVVWLISFPLLLHLSSDTFGGFFSTIQLPPNFILLGIVYFVLGYAIFAVLSAGAGAISPSAREGQQLSTIFILFAVAPLWFSSAIITFPDNPAWVGLSIFPLTAPTVMMLRLGLTEVPAWQLAASTGLMIIFIIAALFVAIRIFRAYLLMYGKRPSLKQILRNLRTG